MNQLTIALACVTAGLSVATVLAIRQTSERRDKILLGVMTALTAAITFATLFA